MNPMIAITLSNSVSAFRSGGSSSPRPEITRFDFTGLTYLDFVTFSSAKYVTASDTSGNNHYFWWFDVGESDPGVDGIGHAINFSPFFEVADFVQSLITAAEATTLWTGTLSGEAAILTMAANGDVTDATAGTSSVNVTITQQGR